VLVIEENTSIGSPVQCAGLLSAAALRETDMEPDSSFVLNSVKGADVYPPSGRRLRITGKETKAYVVSRKMFDRQLALKAAAEGAEYLMKAQAVGLEETVFADDFGDLKCRALKIRHGGELKTLYAKVIIAADGVRSRTAGFAGLPPCEKVLPGIQIEANYKSNDADFVEIFVGQGAPGFFAWTIPASETISRIGLAIDPEAAGKTRRDELKGNELKENELSADMDTDGDRAAGSYLNRLIQNPVISGRLKPGYTDFVVGGIPVGPMKKTYAAGLMVVGDAAGQCKPVSGGGVYTGAVAAKIAAIVAAEAISENDYSEKKMAEYEKRWKKELGRELETGMRAHAYRINLTDKETDELFDELNDPEILEMITEYGDMDHPSVLIRKLMLSKHSLKMMKLFGTFVKTIF
ncbi:MAG: NAD(P)/FAD-dependent oxidoreductase, partial [Methanimicrococcus sp.]|nr:NAD(P)/FAD-dependent oxidoreductase [Methanimicrococcus sp.]